MIITLVSLMFFSAVLIVGIHSVNVTLFSWYLFREKEKALALQRELERAAREKRELEEKKKLEERRWRVSP